MPKVGNKHFKYTKAGIKEAKKYAKKTGKQISGVHGYVDDETKEVYSRRIKQGL